MELKTLQQEIVFTEMIAERNKTILELNTLCVNQKKELEASAERIKELEAAVAGFEAARPDTKEA